MVWVADRGFASAANWAYLTRGGGHYIHAKKAAPHHHRSRRRVGPPGRYATVAGNLRVKEVQVAHGGDGEGVGDNLHRDIIGARQLGMTTVCSIRTRDRKSTGSACLTTRSQIFETC